MPKKNKPIPPDLLQPREAIKFIILLGVVSLFADITYEGARSITGAYLAVLGASATLVGFVAGLGEFIGYTLRFFSGYLADRTGRYWLITIVGYAVNLLAVPLLALTEHWPLAAILIVMERLGKAIRTPARDALLSHAGQTIGMGWGFGLHEAMDQIGAMLGPLIVALVLYYKGSYHQAFAILAIPALFALMALVLAYSRYPHPHDLTATKNLPATEGFAISYRLYLIAASLVAAGYADFPLIAYHFQKLHLFSIVWIPIAYGMAMGIDALMAPILGKLYDQRGIIVLIVVVIVTAFFAPLVFLGGAKLAFLGVALWAVGLGAQQSLMRAIVGNMTSLQRRGAAYGTFNMGFGISWFAGSAIMGILYDKSIPLLIIFILILQFASLPLLIMVMQKIKAMPITKNRKQL